MNTETKNNDITEEIEETSEISENAEIAEDGGDSDNTETAENPDTADTADNPDNPDNPEDTAQPQAEKKIFDFFAAYISDTTRNAVLAASVVILAVCAVLIGTSVGKSESGGGKGGGTSRVSSISTVISVKASGELPVMDSVDDVYDSDILPEWRELHDINNHFVGWLKLGDTVIDYPVMQYLEEEWETSNYTGNTYYLKRDFNRNHSEMGSLFVDWFTPIVDKQRPDNTVIYGHNMSSGLAFHYLINYFTEPGGKSLKSAYYDNPTIDFKTVYDNDRSTYKIFAAMFVNTNPIHGEVFNYYQRRFFESKGDFYDYIGNVMDRSSFYTDVDIEYGDEILTLSTCFFPLGRDAETRVVVVARRVREGEDTTVDTSAAYVNPDPLYFDYYYQTRGGEWGGRNWDTSKVKGFDEYWGN